jgi:hypothetical protein
MKLNIIEILALVFIISVTFSGCIAEKKVTQIPESSHEMAESPPFVEENKPEITITAFTSVYLRDNLDKKDINIFIPTYNISERYYAIYNISIKNNGSDVLGFKLNELHLRAGNETFNTTALEPYVSSLIEVLSNLEKENKIEDSILYPNQTLSGNVVFCVNSLYDKSFLLMYNTTPVISASYEKSLDALIKAENFDYSVALGVPPYSNLSERGGMFGSYEPDLNDYPYIWANWMNRNIFEFFKKSDAENLLKSPPNEIPLTEIKYALKVTSEKNISMLPVKTQFFNNHLFVVVDDAGNELVNKSRIQGMAILNNQTYNFQPDLVLNIPQMNFTNATIVQISFQGLYGWSMAMRMPFVNQDIILDDKLNINVVRYYPIHMVS